jgi:hypothetical protein
MPRPPRLVWALLCVLSVGCSAVTDFDRDKLATSVDHHQTRDGGGNGHEDDMDAAIGAEGDGANPATDTGLVADEGSVSIDDDAMAPLQCKSHAECPRNRLCCGGTCVATSSEARCTDCEAACIATSANACNDRVCGCGANGTCTGDKKYCTGTGRNAVCAQCRDANDCEGHADGRTQCIQGNCAACDPTNNGGCMGNTPICNPTTFTCEACKAAPDNCPGNPVCTASGACGGCTANDAADCTSPTAPICNLAVNPSMCRGCMSDTECMTELSRPYCVGNQRCAICNPANDMGCVATSGTPDCRLNTNGAYQCQACNSTSCATGQRCDTTSGKCVQCRNDDDCDSNSATPYCDTAMGVCRACNTVTGIGGNAWCSLNTLLTRPVCHTSGRCVRCDANNAGICSSPTGRCAVDTAAPQNNQCVECRQGVAADCPAGVTCGTNGRCRSCTAATEATDCPANSANPACDVASGRCVPCTAARGCMGTNGSCLVAANTAMNRCVDCIGQGTTECGGNASVCDTVNHVCVGCLAAGNVGCGTGLCCGGTCRPHSASDCASCGNSCTSPNICMPATSGSTFSCGCGTNANCPPTTPLCTTANTCVQCNGDDNTPCTGRGDLAFCADGQCRRCSPTQPTSCPVGQMCSASFTCVPVVSPPTGGAGASAAGALP